MQVCRDTTLSNEWILGCALVNLESSFELGFYVRDPSFDGVVRSFLETARSLWADSKVDVRPSGEVHLAGEVLGYARILPDRNLLALVLQPSSNVGIGWAMLSVAASQLDAQG
jgi:hypothetical protein